MPNNLMPTIAATPENRHRAKRRGVLRGAAALGGVIALGGLRLNALAAAADSVASAAAPAPGGDQFVALSRFLTGHADLNAALAPRFLDALRRQDARIDTRLDALWSLIERAKLSDMDAYMAQFAGKEKDLTNTAGAVVLAWYLGVVGQGPGAEMVTYADALMYRPTRGITPIPSYGPGPATWGKTPPADSLQDE